jgi:hypothetical protein
MNESLPATDSLIASDPTTMTMSPDAKKINPNQIHTSRGQAIPRHWGGSSYMMGRSMYGANPAEDESKILSYTEWVSKNKNVEQDDIHKEV